MNINVKEWLKSKVTKERYSHLLGAERAAGLMALRFGADVEKARLAALIHDCAKCLSNEELMRIIKENNLCVTDMELKSFKTLHAPVGAFMAQSELGIEDEGILNSIRYHTIGRVGMTLLEKIVFLSDKIEAVTREPRFILKINKKLDETNNIDEAVIICYVATIRKLLARRMIINPQTVDVYNSMLISLEKA